MKRFFCSQPNLSTAEPAHKQRLLFPIQSSLKEPSASERQPLADQNSSQQQLTRSWKLTRYTNVDVKTNKATSAVNSSAEAKLRIMYHSSRQSIVVLKGPEIVVDEPVKSGPKFKLSVRDGYQCRFEFFNARFLCTSRVFRVRFAASDSASAQQNCHNFMQMVRPFAQEITEALSRNQSNDDFSFNNSQNATGSFSQSQGDDQLLSDIDALIKEKEQRWSLSQPQPPTSTALNNSEPFPVSQKGLVFDPPAGKDKPSSFEDIFDSPSLHNKSAPNFRNQPSTSTVASQSMQQQPAVGPRESQLPRNTRLSLFILHCQVRSTQQSAGSSAGGRVVRKALFGNTPSALRMDEDCDLRDLATIDNRPPPPLLLESEQTVGSPVEQLHADASDAAEQPPVPVDVVAPEQPTVAVAATEPRAFDGPAATAELLAGSTECRVFVVCVRRQTATGALHTETRRADRCWVHWHNHK